MTPQARALRRDINVTPLVDIVLVLLIVFIITAPAVDASVKLPRSKHAKPAERAPSAWISVRREGRHALASLEGGRGGARGFRLEDEAARRAFAAALAERVRVPEGAPGPVLIKADADLPNRLLEGVLQACRGAGATRAEFVTGDDSRRRRL
jgi:biopolymer transport protein ExbD